ncbi:tRNA pseudouridine(55) synthase TruB [Rubinisphaera italica]|nr:tRNA pseudouridine(55) synthase TruB [Rubinisphaera italica]
MKSQRVMPLSGLLNINKPAGWTSRDVVNRVQNVIGIRRCGHAGTLDPLATGVLVVCFGRATRLVSYVQQSRKRYLAEFRFGFTSQTDDIEGELTPVPDAQFPSQSELQKAMQSFVGTIQQVPPRYSAVMVKGQRAYALARKGQEFELKSKPVRIDRFDLIDYQVPNCQAIIECGSGTYIRSLGRDIGAQFECGAVMTSLAREAVGDFSIDRAISIEDLTTENYKASVSAPVEAIRHLPFRLCTVSEAEWIRNGRPLSYHNEALENQAEVAILGAEGESLVAICEYRQEESLLKPRIVFPLDGD